MGNLLGGEQVPRKRLTMFLMGAYVESVADKFDFEDSADWREALDMTAPSSINLSMDVQEATAVGYVPWNKIRSAARFFLGFSYNDSSLRLHREAPHQHTTIPWLFCESVSFTPFVPKANNDDFSEPLPKIASPFNDNHFTTYYELAICTARYRNFRCRFLEDEDIDTNQDEWKRWTFVDPDPKIEALQVTGGLSQLTFAEGGAANQPTAGTTKFGAPLAALLSKTGFTFVWLQVPFTHLSEDPNIFYPQKILDRVGTVNSDAAFGFAAGTLLFQPPRFTEKRFPVASADPSELLRFVDVALPFEFFQPEQGKASSAAAAGHNTFPWSGDGTTNGDGKFYLATRDGTTGGRRLIPGTDHRKIFEHVLE